MKKLLSILAILLISIAACSDDTTFTSPQLSVNSYESKIIEFPEAINFILKKDAVISQLIFGNEESLIELSATFGHSRYGDITVNAKARFQKNSFVGEKYFTMILDDHYAISTFLPASTFTKPVIYNITYTGVDLTNINPVDVKFVYFSEDGKYHKTKYKSLTVEPETGTLQVEDAELQHFSRYGFIK